MQKCSSFHELSAFEGTKRTCAAVLAKRRARKAAARKRTASNGQLTESDSLGAPRDGDEGACDMQLVGSGEAGPSSAASGEALSPVDDFSLMAVLRPFFRTAQQQNS